MTIKSWNEDDRPREKMLQKGASGLSDAELLAILIGSGTRTLSAVELAREVLRFANSNLNELGRLDARDLVRNIKGIGPAKAVNIAAAMEIGRRRSSLCAENAAPIKSSLSAAEIFRPVLADLDHEEFWLLMLNNANRAIGKTRLSQGGLTSTVADVRIGLKHAIMNNATGIMIFHNHPSGLCRPSREDMDITAKFKQAAITMDIRFLDHIIICGKEDYYSFSDNGLL